MSNDVNYKNKIKPLDALKYFNRKFIDIWKDKSSDSINEIDLRNILNKTKKINKYIINNKGKNVLVMGHIQSGKTSFFLCLIAKMFDEGSNICFVAAARNDLLKNQVVERIKKIFNINISIFDNRDLKFLKIRKKIYMNMKEGKKTIIIGLKHQDHIKRVNVFLNETQNIKLPFFIDDEGDQASFNDIGKKGNTAIFNQLKQLLLNNPTLSYVSLTATPIPQYFVKNDSPLKPKKAFVLDLSERYIGLDFYHVKKNKNESLEIISNNDYEQIKELNIRPPSLEKSLLTYFIYSSFLHLKNGIPENTSYLIHSHIKIEEHNIMSDWIEDIKNKFLDEILNSEKLKLDIKEIIQKNKYIQIEEKDFNDLLFLMKEHILNSNIIVLNQKNKNFKKELNNIYIGSNLVQRGVTFDNLLVTYFVNRNQYSISNSDTVLQRARWFGYRGEYKFITKIFLDKRSDEDFISLQLGIKDFYKRIYKEEDNEKFDFDKIEDPFLYFQNAKLRGTRRTVILNGKNIINASYQEKDAKNDNDTAKFLMETIESKNEIIYNKDKQIKGIEFDNLYDLKDIYGIKIYEEIFDSVKINGLLLKDIEDSFYNEKVTLILIDNKGEYRKRNVIKENSYFENIFQGRSEDFKKYPGDKDLNNFEPFEDHILIQIHKILNSYNNMEMHKIGIILPKKTLGNTVYRKK